MTLKKLLSLQALSLIKSFKKRYNEIWDIAIYGSFIRGKINASDVDIAIILDMPIKVANKLKLAQELKQHLKKEISNSDIKCVDINDLFDKTFLARQAIIGEGYLIFRKKFLAELLGFKAYYLFKYSLKGLTTSKKIMFQYAMKGRRGQKGIVNLKNCEPIGKGVVKVPIENSEEFKEFLEKNKITYRIYKGLFY